MLKLIMWKLAKQSKIELKTTKLLRWRRKCEEYYIKRDIKPL